MKEKIKDYMSKDYIRKADLASFLNDRIAIGENEAFGKKRWSQDYINALKDIRKRFGLRGLHELLTSIPRALGRNKVLIQRKNKRNPPRRINDTTK